MKHIGYCPFCDWKCEVRTSAECDEEFIKHTLETHGAEALEKVLIRGPVVTCTITGIEVPDA